MCRRGVEKKSPPWLPEHSTHPLCPPPAPILENVMTKTKTEFGEILRRKRIELGLTQEQAASKLKVATSTIYDWESGNQWPRRKILPRIARVLQLETQELIDFYVDAKMKEFRQHNGAEVEA